MHYPVGFFRLPLPAVVGVQDQDFFEAFHGAAGQHRSGFSGLVPPCLVAFLVGVDFPPLSGSGCVRLRWSVKEVPDLPVFAHTCHPKATIFFLYNSLIFLRKIIGA